MAGRFSLVRRHAPDGVTLIELLVVIAITAALAALVLPAVQQARETARRAQCHDHLRQLGVAMALHAERDGAYPIGCIGFFPDESVMPPLPPRYIAWNVQILSMLDEEALQEAFDFGVPAYHPANKLLAAKVLAAFLCPSTVEHELVSTGGMCRGSAFSDYGGLYGVEGTGRNIETSGIAETAVHGNQPRQMLPDNSLGVMLYDIAVAPKAITDGVSKTASIAERRSRRQASSEWVNGTNVFAQEQSTPINGVGLANEIGSPHPGGASLVFCDGHVRFVLETVEQTLLNAMLTRAGHD